MEFRLLLKGLVKDKTSCRIIELTFTVEKSLRRAIYLILLLLIAILVIFKWLGFHLSPSIKYDELVAITTAVFALGFLFSMFEKEVGSLSTLIRRQLELQELKFGEND